MPTRKSELRQAQPGEAYHKDMVPRTYGHESTQKSLDHGQTGPLHPKNAGAMAINILWGALTGGVFGAHTQVVEAGLMDILRPEYVQKFGSHSKIRQLEENYRQFHGKPSIEQAWADRNRETNRRLQDQFQGFDVGGVGVPDMPEEERRAVRRIPPYGTDDYRNYDPSKDPALVGRKHPGADAQGGMMPGKNLAPSILPGGRGMGGF